MTLMKLSSTKNFTMTIQKMRRLSRIRNLRYQFRSPYQQSLCLIFYYSDSDSDEEAELFVSIVPIKIEDGILYPQNEDLGASIA